MVNNKVWFIGSLALLTLLILALALIEEGPDVELVNTAPYLPPVSIVLPEPQDHKSTIYVNAEVTPRWSTTLKAQVRGECIEIADMALVGQHVEKGDVLLRIEDSAYQVQVHEAEQALLEAKLVLLREQLKSAEAKRDWQRSGGNKPPADLALHKPQLEIADSAVNAAASRLQAAQRKITYTQIRAPFSGLVTARHISLGQAVTEGEELLHLIHRDQYDIAVSLNQMQWAQLSQRWRNKEVSVRNLDGAEIAGALIKRGGGYLDPKKRQYKLFLEVDGLAYPDVISGDFVRILLPGRIVRHSLSIPESALTRDGFIWYVDDERRLRRFASNALYTREGNIIVNTPMKKVIGDHYPSQWRIATTPLASFLVGRQVNPTLATELAAAR